MLTSDYVSIYNFGILTVTLDEQDKILCREKRATHGFTSFYASSKRESSLFLLESSFLHLNVFLSHWLLVCKMYIHIDYLFLEYFTLTFSSLSAKRDKIQVMLLLRLRQRTHTLFVYTFCWVSLTISLLLYKLTFPSFNSCLTFCETWQNIALQLKADLFFSFHPISPSLDS